jgi:hypothetical protein
MFLPSPVKRGHHPPENILKFNVPGGWMPLFTGLAMRLSKNMAASYFCKNYLTVFQQKWDLCMYLLCVTVHDSSKTTFRILDYSIIVNGCSSSNNNNLLQLRGLLDNIWVILTGVWTFV